MPRYSNPGGDLMKAKRRPIVVRKPNLANPTVLPNAEWPSEKQTLETVALVLTAKSTRNEQMPADAGVPADYVKALVSIATNAWRAKTKMVDTTTGEVREEMKRVDRHIEAIYRSLTDVGVVIRDHTGEAYDEGQPMKVVASKPTPGLDKKRVSETLLPSIFWNERLVQNGEIEIATPASQNTSAESRPHQP
jgi:hypothetical protein